MTYTCENCGLELKNRQELADHVCNSDYDLDDTEIDDMSEVNEND